MCHEVGENFVQSGGKQMKHFIDGDQVTITLDDFVDLQQSPAVFIPVDSEDGRDVIAGGVRQLPVGRLSEIFSDLKRQRDFAQSARGEG